MKSFKDTGGRTWAVAVNVASVKRVKARAGVDLLTIGSGNAQLIVELADNPVALVDVLFALVEPDAKAAGVSDEDFGLAMGGDALDDAAAALMEELTDFFPRGRRTVLRAGLAKIDEARAAALTRATAAVAAIDPSTLGTSSTSSPASPASTLAP